MSSLDFSDDLRVLGTGLMDALTPPPTGDLELNTYLHVFNEKRPSRGRLDLVSNPGMDAPDDLQSQPHFW